MNNGQVTVCPSKGMSVPNVSVLSRCVVFFQSNYPRLKADLLKVTLTDLRETDDGIYSVKFGENDVRDIIDLKVLGKTIFPSDTV